MNPIKLKPSLAAVAMAVAATLVAIRPARTAADTAPASSRVIAISARRYEFSPNTITIQKGEPVTLSLRSQDRAHGFLVKPLGIDTDITPGKNTDVTIRPETAGTYTVICDHYCGLGHGGMKMTIVVQ